MSLLVKLGGHVIPAGIPAPDVEVRELYSLLMSQRKRNYVPQRPIDSTLTVSSQARDRMAGHPKDDLLKKKYLKYLKICLRVLAYLAPRVFFGEMIYQPNLGFCWGLYMLPHL